VAPTDGTRDLPFDIAAVILLVSLTNVFVLVPVVSKTPLRIFFGFLFALFLPGYAFVSILFPETNEVSIENDGQRSGVETDTDSVQRGASWSTGKIDLTGRLVLSVISSVAIVLLMGLALSHTPWGFRTVPVLVAVSVFALLCSGLAVSRRLEVAPERRFRVSYEEWLGVVESDLLSSDTKVDMFLNIAITCSILVAFGGGGYALSVSDPSDPLTEFYVLNENEDGQLEANEYPQNFTRDEAQSLYVGVGNYQGTTTNYTIVVEVQRVDVSGDSVTVVEERELERFTTTVHHNETRVHRRTLAPTLAGDRLRLVFLLFQGPPPADPGTENAHRELHLWINVSES